MEKATSLLVRNLDGGVKRRLRLRAAGNERSMEDEARAILGAALSAPAPTGKAEPEPAATPPPAGHLAGANVLLIIGGSIAAYKSLDLIRRLRERGATVRAVMTKGAQEFVTALSASALTGNTVFTDLFDRNDEHDVGHIRLAREASVVIVAPATADLIARMATGRADDLATAVLLATRAPILLAPAMNPAMWSHRATVRNVETLRADGMHFVGPNTGEMAEAREAGRGRMAEPLEIVAAADALLAPGGPLAGRHVIVTSGPTHEPVDPVRYLANRSSGRQGHAIAAAAARAGARVTLVSGPVAIADPAGVTVIHVETAREMLEAVTNALPADVAVMAAAVADWRPEKPVAAKIKKTGNGAPPALALAENPDILATIGHDTKRRPRLVVGFAAETDDLIRNATAKLKRKGADWIVANDVSPAGGVMGGADNTVHILAAGAGSNGRGEASVEDWPRLSKDEVATRLVARIAAAIGENDPGRDQAASAWRGVAAAIGKEPGRGGARSRRRG